MASQELSPHLISRVQPLFTELPCHHPLLGCHLSSLAWNNAISSWQQLIPSFSNAHSPLLNILQCTRQPHSKEFSIPKGDETLRLRNWAVVEKPDTFFIQSLAEAAESQTSSNVLVIRVNVPKFVNKFLFYQLLFSVISGITSFIHLFNACISCLLYGKH